MIMQLDTFPSQAKVDFIPVNKPSSSSSNTCSIMQEKHWLNTTCWAQNQTSTYILF